MRKPLVAGNWKMNASRADAQTLIEQLVDGFSGIDCEALVCPPSVYLPMVCEWLSGSGIAVGGQNCSQHASGAYTGEVSAEMLKDVGCQYVIVGHSERRALYGETDQVVVEKFAAAQKSGLIPILCVGETLAERQSGNALSVIARQVDAVIDQLGKKAFCHAVIAYEPVWAIGTGETATPDQAEEIHAAIRAQVAAVDAGSAESLRILYGGSVNPANAETLFLMPNIDGGLVGGASLKANEFLTICQAAKG